MKLCTCICTKFHKYILNGFPDMKHKSTSLMVLKNDTVHTIFKLTRTIRKSDYTPALVLPKHMADIFEEKCREKEKYREEQIAECPFSTLHHNLSL